MPLDEVLNEIRKDKEMMEKNIADLLNAFEQKHIGLNVTGIEVEYDADSKGSFLENKVQIKFEIIAE